MKNTGNKQEKLKIQWVDIDNLKPSEYNPRKWTEKEINDLKESIKRFGIVDPLIINSAENRKNIVIGGHFRLTILKELGYKKVPVVYVNIPDIKKEKELNLRLNKNLGEWNIELLANFDEELLKEVGFESEELDKIFDLKIEDSEKDDYVPEVKKTDIKYGDIFQLGNHRLMCGDATKKEDVEKLMNGEKAGMVFTDPPYSILGSSTGFVQDTKMIYPFFRLWLNILCHFIQGDVYICCDWRTLHILQELTRDSSLSLKNVIVWYKLSGGLGNAYMNAYELIAYFRTSKNIKIRDLNVWEIRREKETGHYAQKPVELCERAIKNSSKRGDIVLDLFGGSGTTLIACEKLNRRCYMMEIEPIYAEVILKRWEKFTGKKAQKISEK
jgi:DNA modification methylase